MLPEEQRPIEEENAFAQFGVFVHGILEQHALNKLAVFELLDAYADGFDKAVSQGFPPNSYCDLRNLYFNDGFAFFQQFDGLIDGAGNDYKVLAVEQFIKTPMQGFWFRGYIDLLLKDAKGRLIVHDWKSLGRFKSKEDMKKYRRQLYLYAKWVYEHEKRMPDILQFHLFRKQRIEAFNFQQCDYGEALKWAADSVAEIRACKKYPPSVDPFFCAHLCGYRNVCEWGAGERR